DVWSCGVICYILLCGYPPFYGDQDPDILRMVKKGNFTFPPEDWDDVSAEAKECISLMLTFNADKRPTAAKMLEHRWLDKNAELPKGKVAKDLCKHLRKFNEGSRMKKVALTLIAQQLKDEDLEQLRTTFLLLDKNKDGTLTIEEIQNGIKDSAIEIPADLIEIMKNLDTDGSGNIDYTEFIAATLNQKQYLKRDVLWSAFRVFDKDGDGTITKQELGSILKEQADGEVIMNMVQEVDLDGDGQISFDEFVKMMEK
ncbi:CPK2, partial [Symbiodinium sp. KB8]